MSTGMELQLSPLSPRANPTIQLTPSRASFENIHLDRDRKGKSVRFAEDRLENRLVSALEAIAAGSQRQNDLLDHISKVEEDQLTLLHQGVKAQRTSSVLSARVYNSQMVSQMKHQDAGFSSAPLAAVPNGRGIHPTQEKLPVLDSTSALMQLRRDALERYLQFYSLTKPVVYLDPTSERQYGAMRFVLARHVGCWGLHGTGSSITEWGASEE